MILFYKIFLINEFEHQNYVIVVMKNLFITYTRIKKLIFLLCYNFKQMIYNSDIIKDVSQFQNGLNEENKQFMLYVQDVSEHGLVMTYFDLLSYYQKPHIMKWLYVNIVCYCSKDWLGYAEKQFLHAVNLRPPLF